MNRQLIAPLRHKVEHAADRQIRISRQVMLGQDDMLRGIADVTKEAIAPIIKRAAEVCPARTQLELLRHRVEAKIVASHHERLRVRTAAGTNLSAVLAAGTMVV